MDNLHIVQMQILRELTFNPNSNFSSLNISGLTNDHFSYHVRTLVEMGYVEKVKKGYSLSNKGKIYSAQMDTDKNKIEKLPKVSVFVIVVKKIKGVDHYAIQVRTKEPYYGYVGFITGKVRYGETLKEAALRELKEEMGLIAEIEHCYVLHEMVYDKTGNQLEDKFFNIMKAYNVKGSLINKTQEGRNQWLTEKEFEKLEPKYHNEMEIFHWFKKGEKGFKEEKYVIEKF